MTTISSRWRLACGAGLAALALAGAAHAQVRLFSIPSQPAVKAIPEFARQAGVQIIAPAGELAGVLTPGVRGELDVRAALRALIANTGLEIASDNGSVITLRRTAGAARSDTGDAQRISEVVVTGSRIRGVAPSSPVITYGAAQIHESGYATLGDLIRAIPQNFAGGQNPGIVGGAGGRSFANQNISGGSSLNLRGLGPDATLTLLNGRRLSYDGFAQAVDLSTIPVAAIDRLQIVADGASAIYGSDAVGGVANIILKRDYVGATATALYGGATSGGKAQRQASLTFGEQWTGGAVLAAFQYDRNEDITVSQRSYTRGLKEPYSIYPNGEQWSGLISLHQALGSRAQASLEVSGADRRAQSWISYPTAGYDSRNRVKSYSFAPSIKVAAPAGWTVELGGVLARHRNEYLSFNYDGAGALTSRSKGCYCNTLKMADVTAEGPIVTLAAGQVRAALGGGYRENTFFSPGTPGKLNSRFAYSEVNVPLVSPDMGVPAVERLAVNGAIRYERYSDLGGVTTPKLGVTYNPIPDLTLRGSWGRSFKAPTLLQQFQPQYVAVYPTSGLGGGYAPDSTALLIGGGSRDLRPERAETWTVGAVYQPQAVAGLKLEVNVFHIDYTNRVISPLANFAQAFTNPVYRPYLTLNPTLAMQRAVIATANPFYSLVGAYDPAKVVALVNNAYANAARQEIEGADVTVSYTRPLAGGEVTGSASGSWLRYDQQILAGAPQTRLSGTIYNPPRFRGRAGLTWRRDGVTLAGFVNHQSALRDVNATPVTRIDDQTTMDLSAQYRLGDAGVFEGVELGVAVQNLTNEAPPRTSRPLDYTPPYDSLNYSVVGRFLAVSLTKRW